MEKVLDSVLREDTEDVKERATVVARWALAIAVKRPMRGHLERIVERVYEEWLFDDSVLCELRAVEHPARETVHDYKVLICGLRVDDESDEIFGYFVDCWVFAASEPEARRPHARICTSYRGARGVD